jgi:pimeloyl-ACP methyl ester carboxylesterase
LAADSDGPAPRLPHVSPGTLRWVRAGLGLLQRLSPALAASVAFQLFLTPTRRRLDPEDAAALALAQEHRLVLHGQPLMVRQWGDGPRRAVLLHGWGSHAPRFLALALALADQGFKVLALDAPAHGSSGGHRSSLAAFQQALQAVVSRFGTPDLMVGHSLGALAMALTLGDSPGTQQGAGALVLVSMPADAAFLVTRYQQMFDVGSATALRLHQRFLRRFGHPPEYFSAHRVAPTLALPVLLVHDQGDDIVPAAHSKAMLALLPTGQLHLTEGKGHSGLLRDEATINVITSFAAEHAHGADQDPAHQGQPAAVRARGGE